jgi:uncharacterized protein (TIGR00730 family)
MSEQQNNQPSNQPLTRKEMHEYSAERIALITKEFRDGFEFLGDYPKSVTFFGGTRFKEGDFYYEKARSLGAKVWKELGYSVFTGGGPGIMEAANRGVFEAGGQSLGLTIELPTEQAINKYLTKSLDFYYFFSRKVCMTFSAEAFIFFPGGFGTLDEFTEILTLVQTGKIEKLPIILVGAEYWSKLDDFFRKEILSRKLIDEDEMLFYKITDDEDEIIDIIRKAPVRDYIKFDYVPKK